MAKAPAWPRPYLIALKPTVGTKIFLDLPDRKSFVDNIPGIGEIEIKIGGLTWELPREYLNSISGKVPSPISAIVSAHTEDALDLIQQGPVNIVSEKFRSFAEGKIKKAEFLPMSVEFTPIGKRAVGGGVVSNQYYWLNSWDRIDVVNRPASDLLIMPSDEKDAFQPNGGPMFSSWRRLDLQFPDFEPCYYGVSGLFGGQRFVSPEFQEEMKALNMNVQYVPLLLDQVDPVKSNDQIFKIRDILNA